MKITFTILLISYTYGIWNTEADQNVTGLKHPCDSDIYCYGDILHYTQTLNIFEDSKKFVDMKMKLSRNDTYKHFNEKFPTQKNKSRQITKKGMLNFINEHFENEDNEFEEWIPSDWTENPKFFDSIDDKNLKCWAAKINKIWKTLGRKIKDDVRLHPEQYSMIYVENPVIIPGGRFREIYYWDTYWIIRGLLLCEMKSTAKGMINNYLSMVESYGHVPNGGRTYYIGRSQPPMLIPMVKSYVDNSGDTDFLKDNIYLLEKEFNYWITNHKVVVEKFGINYTLVRYKDSSGGPRPESYREDKIKGEVFQNDEDKENFYSELKAAAESGWDFSSRWFILDGTNQGNITNLKTRSIIPVDLNALVYWGADILSDFYRDMNVSDKAQEYETIANQWRDAVTAVLWHEEIGSWLDYDMINNIKRDYFYPTNISPLWTGCFDRNNTEYFVSRVLKYLNKTQIRDNRAGVPTTLKYSDEQWDMPNAWAPLQYITVMALDSTSNKHAKIWASEIAEKWMCTNYLVHNIKNKMYEKYQVNKIGEEGRSNGEYPIQEGFGWTNGVILEFLQKYKSVDLKTKCIDTLTQDDRDRLKVSKSYNFNCVPD